MEEEGHSTIAELHRSRELREDVDGLVTDVTPGGLIVEVRGTRGYLPISRIRWASGVPSPDDYLSTLREMVGKHIRVRVLEVRRQAKRDRILLLLDQKTAVT